ncbi:cytochrome P450 [Delitschia confertaspora ATCC 74209]|uniref:Cytochrome P450 n=1 Tax=Delitschia confertaspora ATCC 74209 TaxID=1513339 RepID=A0A9P4JMG8_9PLEO|nr:cytochrome P450 [Delitschia confertaspora ATCC 74209]
MSILLTIIITALAAGLYELSKVGRRPKGYPPGPPTLPLIGNLHQMPKKRAHVQFSKWAEEYGPIYSLMLGTQCMIILSSDRVIKDLLDKRGNIYSSRPEMYLGQVVSNYQRLVLMEYGPTWRMIRTIIHAILNVKAAASYVPYQDLENKQMLSDLLKEPDKFIHHIRRYSNSFTTQMVFGFRVTSIDDPKLVQLYEGFEKFCEVSGTTIGALLDLFPVLRRLPDALLPIRKYAKRLHKEERELYVGHWMDVKRAIKGGSAKPCFCVDLARAQSKENISDDLAGYVSGTLLEAGSDTTAATLIGFVQAMILFPEVQENARKELDRVCGDRMPTMEDEPNLPYIRGCVKESLRWMPPVDVPHAAIKDDEYMGFKIPKGTMILSNVRGIHFSPTRYPNPHTFSPSRYLSDSRTAAESANLSDPSQRDHFAFGAGRRICQGMHIAERSLFLSISRMLWAFTFLPKKDKNGVEVLPDPEDLTEGILIQPRPFLADIRVRGKEYEKEIMEAWDGARRGLLDGKGQWKSVP